MKSSKILNMNLFAKISGVVAALALTAAGAHGQTNLPANPGFEEVYPGVLYGVNYSPSIGLPMGTGYPATGTAVATSGGSGSGATVSFTATGGVVDLDSIDIVDGGSGYQLGDILTIVSGNSDATFGVIPDMLLDGPVGPLTPANQGFGLPYLWLGFNGGTWSSDEARTGTGSGYLNNSGIPTAPSFVFQTFSAAPGEIYYFSAWVKVQTQIDFFTLKINFRDSVGGVNIQPLQEDPELIGIINNDSTYPGIQSNPLVGSTISNGGELSDGWIYVETRGTVPEGVDTIEFYCQNVPLGAGAVWIDDIFAYKLDGPSYVYPKLQFTATPNAGDMDITWKPVVPRDYTIESTPLLAGESTIWTTEASVGGMAAETMTVTLPGQAPLTGEKLFYRIQSDPVDRGVPLLGVGTRYFDFNCPNMENWVAFARFETDPASPIQPSVFADYYDTCDAPFTVLTAPVSGNFAGTATFGMNTEQALNPDWAGATQYVYVGSVYWSPENSLGIRPFTNLRGRTVSFQGNVTVSEAYDPGNEGQIFIQIFDTDNNSVMYKALNLPEDNPSTGDYDYIYYTKSTGAFQIRTIIPESDINSVWVGFRNSGIVGTAGEMTINQALLGTNTLLPPAPTAGTDLIQNGDFNEGTETGSENLAGWELYQSWLGGTITPLADGFVTADGGGTAVFSVDADDSGGAGLRQTFWMPKNTSFAIDTYNLYGKTVTFAGNVVASGYANGNSPQVGIQVINTGFSDTEFSLWLDDLTTEDLDDSDGLYYSPSDLGEGAGRFRITTTIGTTADLINFVQTIFRNNIATPGGGGQMTISNVSLTVN